MKCINCNSENPEDAKLCTNCGQFLKNDVQPKKDVSDILKEPEHKDVPVNQVSQVTQVPQTENMTTKITINPFIIVIGVMVIILIILIVIYFKPKRDALLSKSNGDYIFTIGEDQFAFNSSYKAFNDKGYYINDSDIKIKYDTISLNHLYKDDKVIALAAFYCPNKEGCSYMDTTIVKLNFYDNSNLKVNDINKNDSYNQVVSKLGKESGVLANDNTYYIWSKGNNIGDSYIMISFNGNSIKNIRLGVWWYDGEYDHTVKAKGE